MVTKEVDGEGTDTHHSLSILSGGVCGETRVSVLLLSTAADGVSMTVDTVTVTLQNGREYVVLRVELDSAVLAWDQWRNGHQDVKLTPVLVTTKCKEIAARIHPSTYPDYWATERLARALLSVISKRQRYPEGSVVRVPPPSITQLRLFTDDKPDLGLEE